jgi:hypothetical protein
LFGGRLVLAAPETTLVVVGYSNFGALVAALPERKRLDYALRVATGDPHRVSADPLRAADVAVPEEEPEVNLVARRPKVDEHDRVSTWTCQ